ncbi:MAG: hypothetical protein KGN76_00225 [Acidobacteriota bacterium]|nr:hypothetical protein [Acidobacteriota bacterium]
MRLVLVLAACLAAAFSLWVSGGTMAVTQAGPDAARLGLLPSLALLAALFTLAIVAAAVCWRRNAVSRTLPLLASVIVLLPWWPWRIPAVFFVWAGPARFWVWGAVALGLWLARPPAPAAPRPAWRAWLTTPARASLVAALLAGILSGVASHTIARQLPSGDEPHYLVITQSLLIDHTLQIDNVHRRGDYRAYWPTVLKPDYLHRGLNGHIYSIHAPGLPVLVLPAFALFGYPGVKIFLVLLAALGSIAIWRAAYALTGDAVAAWFGWAAVALSIPYFFLTFTIFPDGPGALIVLVGVLPLIESVADPAAAVGLGRAWSLDGWPDTWRWALRGLLLAALPWLHSRFAIIAGCLALCLLLEIARRPGALRRAAAFLAIPVISAIAWFSFFYVIYGTPSPTAPYAGATQSSIANMARGIPGLLFDQQFGLLPNAPIYLFAAAGLWVLWRRSRRLTLELLVVQIPYSLVVAAYQMWWGGTSAPVRFLVPVLLPMAVPAALLFARARHLTTRALGLLALWFSLGLTAAFALVDGGSLVYNFRDSFAHWLLWMSPLVNLPRALPSLFVTDPPVLHDVLLQAAVWLGAILLTGVALTLAERRAGRVGVATALPVAAAVAGMLGVTIVWPMNHDRTMTPAAGQIALLRAYEPGTHDIALEYRPLHRIPVEALPAQLRLGPVLPDVPAGDQPLVAMYSPPAGVYRLDVGVWRPGTGTVAFAIDSQLPPILTVDLASLGAGADLRREVRLPVTPRGLIIDADAAARQSLSHVWLQPLSKRPPSDPLATQVPRRSVRSGPGLLFLMGGQAYVEAGGAWVAGGGSAEFVLAPDNDAPAQLLIRNAPVPNDVRLQSGAWSLDLHLTPGEQRSIEIPRLPGTLGTDIAISTSAGFQPYLVDPRSTDHRRLGCWIELH